MALIPGCDSCWCWPLPCATSSTAFPSASQFLGGWRITIRIIMIEVEQMELNSTVAFVHFATFRNGAFVRRLCSLQVVAVRFQVEVEHRHGCSLDLTAQYCCVRCHCSEYTLPCESTVVLPPSLGMAGHRAATENTQLNSKPGKICGSSMHIHTKPAHSTLPEYTEPGLVKAQRSGKPLCSPIHTAALGCDHPMLDLNRSAPP